MPSISSFSPPAFEAQNEVSAVAVPVRSYPPVEGDELAFALTLFVAAANQTLTGGSGRSIARSTKECEEPFARLCGHYSLQAPPGYNPIRTAFEALWHHYDGSALRHSLCARVLGFYLLLESTGGKQLLRWIDPCPDHPEAVLLHAELVCALAAVDLGEDGQLFEPSFYSAIERSMGTGEA